MHRYPPSTFTSLARLDGHPHTSHTGSVGTSSIVYGNGRLAEVRLRLVPELGYRQLVKRVTWYVLAIAPRTARTLAMTLPGVFPQKIPAGITLILLGLVG